MQITTETVVMMDLQESGLVTQYQHHQQNENLECTMIAFYGNWMLQAWRTSTICAAPCKLWVDHAGIAQPPIQSQDWTFR